MSDRHTCETVTCSVQGSEITGKFSSVDKGVSSSSRGDGHKLCAL